MTIAAAMRPRAKGFAFFAGHKLKQAAGNQSLIELEALPCEVLHPEELRKGTPAIVLEGELDKITALGFGDCVRTEIESVRGAGRRIGPTKRIELRHAVIGFGHVFSPSAALWLSSEYRIARGAVVGEFDTVACQSSRVGCHYFGHWLRDDAATGLLASGEAQTIAVRSPDWPDKDGYKNILGQSFTEYDFVYADTLILYDDIYQNEHKAVRLRQLRERARSNIGASGGGHICYLRRGQGGKARGLSNELEVMETLERRGVKIVSAEADEPAQLLAALMGARMVISIEGSQLSHAMLALADGAAVVTIQPPTRFVNSHYDWACALGMSYGIVVADGTSDNLVLDTDRLLATLDLVDRET